MNQCNRGFSFSQASLRIEASLISKLPIEHEKIPKPISEMDLPPLYFGSIFKVYLKLQQISDLLVASFLQKLSHSLITQQKGLRYSPRLSSTGFYVWLALRMISLSFSSIRQFLQQTVTRDLKKKSCIATRVVFSNLNASNPWHYQNGCNKLLKKPAGCASLPTNGAINSQLW